MNAPSRPGSTGPWYRHRWPWLLVLLPLTAVVVASFFTLWLAMRQPDYLVVDEGAYDDIKSDLRAQNSCSSTTAAHYPCAARAASRFPR